MTTEPKKDPKLDPKDKDAEKKDADEKKEDDVVEDKPEPLSVEDGELSRVLTIADDDRDPEQPAADRTGRVDD